MVAKSKTIGNHQLTLVAQPEQEISTQEEHEEVCPICAGPFELFSTGFCNHPICHVCSLRLRTLYKSNLCPLCKSDIPSAVYAPSHEPFESYDLKTLIKDAGALRGCYYVNETVKDTIHHTTSLKCPACTEEFTTWKLLKSHAKQSHSKMFCDLCTRFGNVFTWECQLYTSAELKNHQARGDPKLAFRGHPECEFCTIRFYGNDELLDHCRKQHESCFLCARLHNIHNQYYKSYKVE
jgi:DNA-directed RNA polymerase subunit M/transcription elongation factor TFIIS